MLFVFVNKERNKVIWATYDENRANEYRMFHKVKLGARYFNDVEIWVVEDE